MKYVFDVQVACEVGMASAVLLENIAYWVRYNKANNQNFHDGYYWTYNSYEAFHKLFPFMTARSIKYELQKLERNGYVKTGEYNCNKFDRTKWYTLTEKSAKFFDTVDGIKLSTQEETKCAHRTKKSSVSFINTNINSTDINDEEENRNDTSSSTSQNPTEQIQEEEQNPDFLQIVQSYQSNIAHRPMLSPIEMDKLKKYLAEYGKDMVMKAIERAVLRNKCSIGMIEYLLRDWKENGYDEPNKPKERKDAYGRTNRSRSSHSSDAEPREWTPANNGWHDLD